MHLQTLKFHNFCNTSTPQSSASRAINDIFSPNSPRNGAHSHSNQKRIEVSAPKNRSISLSLSNGFGEEERVRSPVVKGADIATLGNLCVDVVLSVQRLPLPSLEERRAYMEELSASRPDEMEENGNQIEVELKDESFEVKKQLREVISKVKSEIRGLMFKIKEPLCHPRIDGSKVSRVQLIREFKGVKLLDPTFLVDDSNTCWTDPTPSPPPRPPDLSSWLSEGPKVHDDSISEIYNKASSCCPLSFSLLLT
ncbi:hypothetical protein Scep_029826 [Stephania cephalantha]|uniref:Uncharacterized protein n=1 Tax=Stephania cephalantha TaxID=152367 RepID=A0AAP0HI09_9MAGN